MKLGVLLAFVAVLVLFIVFEGWRQRRAMRRRGERRGTRPSLIGTGLLELQAMLEPERKVETIQQEMGQKDRLDPGWRVAKPGDGDDDATPDGPAPDEKDEEESR